jgi:hypothetical protein
MSSALEYRAGMSFFTDDHDDDGPAEQETPPSVDPPKRRRGRRALGALTVTGLVAGVASVVLSSSAFADPSANDWYRLRMCESSNNYSINTGNGHYGAYQFDVSTWRSVGGVGLPSAATPAEQDKRALLLYRSRGWQPWQCATILGLSTSRSTAPTVVHTAHGWPGVYYQPGDSSSGLVAWQKQMRARGATILQGTGQYGPKTEAVVKAIQGQNGLAVTGTIGPMTWELAWTGRFVATAAIRSGPPPRVAPVAPAWPGVVYSFGDQSANIAAWQRQMRARGATTLTGTGVFGPKTEAVAKALEAQNGLPAEGLIGPKTWALAWTGTYR